MPRPDWDTELEFTPEELADMGAELLHRPARAAQPPAAAKAAAPRRKRVSSLLIPVDTVPRTESGRVISSAGSPPPSPRVGGAESASDAIVERAFQFTARSLLSGAAKEEEPAGPSFEERTFEQTLRGYSAPDSAIPAFAPEAPVPQVAAAPPAPPSATPAAVAPAAPAAPAPADDAIALDDADVIVDQVDGAGASGARPAWPEVDTPPTGSDLVALNAAAARLRPAGGAPPAPEAGAPEAVEPVETDEISEPSPSPAPAAPRDVPRGERAFPRVDTVPEAPVGAPPPMFRAEPPASPPPAAAAPVEPAAEGPPVEERRADAGVVLAVFDAFGSRPNSILRTEVGEEAGTAAPTPTAPAPVAEATASAAPPETAAAGVAAPASGESDFAKEEVTDVGAAAAAPAEPAPPTPAESAAEGAPPEAAATAEVADAEAAARAAEAAPAPTVAAAARPGGAARAPTYAEALEAAEEEDAAEAARAEEAAAAEREAAAPAEAIAAAADLEPELSYETEPGAAAEEPAEELSGNDLEEVQEPAAPSVPPLAPPPVAAREAAPAPPAAAAPAPPAATAPAPPAATAPTPAAPPPAEAAPGAEEQGAEELSGADLEEIPDIVADQVAGAPAATAAAAQAREPGQAADQMMAAAMVAAPRPTEEEGEELSGADLEEVHEAPTPGVPPVPVAATKAAPAGEAAKAPPPTPTGEPKPVRRRKKRPWFEEVFDEDYLRTLPFLTPEQTKREVGFIEETLALNRDMHVLDLGCGWGRHAMELASRGHRVTGIDLSLALLIRAADEAQRRGLQVNFVHGDMRELTFDDPFDAAYCMGTSFGFFDDDTNRKVAQGLAEVVKPGGRLLVEVVNRDYIIGDLPARVWWEGDGCVVLEEVEFNYYTSRLVVRRSVVFEDGRQLEHDISVRVYSLHEVGRLLQYAGFRVLDVSGHLSIRGRFFGAASRQLLVVAERRSSPQGE